MAISNIIKKAGKTVINATANLISAPAQIKAAMAQSQANSDVATIKRARSYDNAPNFNNDGTVSDAFKARSLANDVTDRLKAKAQKAPASQGDYQTEYSKRMSGKPTRF